MKYVSHMYYLGIPGPVTLRFSLSFGPGCVCRTILYDVLLLLHMEMEGKWMTRRGWRRGRQCVFGDEWLACTTFFLCNE